MSPTLDNHATNNAFWARAHDNAELQSRKKQRPGLELEESKIKSSEFARDNSSCRILFL